MKRSSQASLFALSLAFLIVGRTAAVELLNNGNFETFSNGIPTGWNYIRGDGPAVLESTNASPFTNVYSSSTRSVLLSESTETGFTPDLRQSFAPQTGMILFSFEFRVSSFAGDPWYALPVASTNYTLNNIRLGGSIGQFALADGTSSAFTLAISTGTWYQVSMTFNLTTLTYSGSITPFGGSATTWNNCSLLQSVPDFGGIIFDDSSGSTGGLNGPIALDNVSVRPVPEPSTFASLIFVAGLILFSRRLRLCADA